MGIRDKDRKILWGRAGSHCAICRQSLVADATSTDSEAVVGDEAHIVAQSADGPRGGQQVRRGEVDGYDNLILLCRVHHKMIDDQPNHYTTAKLHELKSRHEQWVLTALHDPEDIRLVRDPSRPLTHLRPLTTGQGVWDIISGAAAYKFDSPSDAQIGTELVDAADEFLQLAHDYGEISEDITDHGRSQVRQAQRALQEHIKRLAEGGLLVFGDREHFILRGGVKPPMNWVTAVLAVVPATDPGIIQLEADGGISAEGMQVKTKPKLKLLYDETSERYCNPNSRYGPNVLQHRVGIFNAHDEEALRHIRVHLIEVSPPPRHRINEWEDPVTPCALPMLSNGDASIGITLAPGREEFWVLGYTATGSDGSLNAGRFAPTDDRWRGLPWQFDPDEQCRLCYEVVCDDRKPVQFSIVLFADGGNLHCRLEG